MAGKARGCWVCGRVVYRWPLRVFRHADQLQVGCAGLECGSVIGDIAPIQPPLLPCGKGLIDWQSCAQLVT
jgi:hypothetical protein